MPIPDSDPKLAARLHRRWHGIGALVFMVFYSLFFAGHLELGKTTVYLKDGAVLAADSASFYGDLTMNGADAGSRGTGVASSFLLVHRLPLAVLKAGWQFFSQDEGTAAKSAMGTLQAFAGALAVVFVYQLLLWSGLSTWNAVMFAAILGCSTTMTVFTAIPHTSVFTTLGLTAMLAAMGRGKRARWWEFSAAAFYSVLCSHWNLIPVLILAVVRSVWRWRTSDSFKPLPAVLGSMGALMLFSAGAMMLQSRVYPRSSQADVIDVAKSSWSTLNRVKERAAETPWLSRTQDAFFTNVVAPVTAMLDHRTARERVTRRTVSLADEEWFVLDFRHAIWAAWLILMLLGLTGLPAAAEHAGVATGALLVLGWQVLFFGALEEQGQRLLHSATWTPAVIAIVGVGVGRALEKHKTLRAPLAALLLLFVSVQSTRSLRFLHEISEQLRVSASM